MPQIKKNIFKITQGALKNTQLEFNPSDFTRPTKAIVKQSFFNTMREKIYNCVFIEGFGGCGSMGLEALSLGANCAYFYENNTKAHNILQNNINKAKQVMPSLNAFAINDDFFSAFMRDLEQIQKINASNFILYLDPPFSMRSGFSEIYDKCLEFLRLECMDFIVFEHYSMYNLPTAYANFFLSKIRKFGKSALAYYERN